MYGSSAPGAGGVVGVQGFGPHGGGTIWAGTSGTNCVGEAVVAASSAAQAIATWVEQNGSKVSSDLVFWAGSYLAGEITALEFIGVFFAIATSSEVLMILAAVGLTVGGIWLLYKCIHG